ncbi:MAG: hypothetical protein HQ583_03875, partial [Candidatus Abyssubacteria bacterium]|nr:hypothetical protein [Candidatus Abyssubacteria bacterium]
RRRKKQSGETTIMEGRPSEESGMDDFGLDDSFGDLDTLGDTGDSGGAVSGEIGAEPAGTGPPVEDAFSDFDFTTEGADIAEGADITTGGTDFDERTMSDEVSGGETDLAAPEDDLAGMFPGEAQAPPLEEAFPEPEPTSLVKRILTVVIIVAVALGAGIASQLFLWPMVKPIIKGADAEEVKLDVQFEINAATKKKQNLTKELGDFTELGGPEEVKGLKNNLAEARDTHGSMEEFQSTYDGMKNKETAYDKLVATVSTIESNISKTNDSIEGVKSEIEETRKRVHELAQQTEKEYERFRLELVRAEFGQRLLIELQMEDIESFRAEVTELEKRLSRLTAPESPSANVASGTFEE